MADRAVDGPLSSRLRNIWASWTESPRWTRAPVMGSMSSPGLGAGSGGVGAWGLPLRPEAPFDGADSLWGIRCRASMLLLKTEDLGCVSAGPQRLGPLRE